MTPAARPTAVGAATVRVAALYALAAAGAAVIRAIEPFAHGWWLVAYLLLVGALAPTALFLGALRLLAPAAELRIRRAFAAWQLGAPLVPLGVFAALPLLVAAGGVLELVALYLLARDTRAGPRRASPPWSAAYALLIIGLAVSVVIGMRLGDALPV